MKKLSIFRLFIALVVVSLIGLATTLSDCGGKAIGNNTIKVENGKEYESYREACRDGDFDAAHKFLDRLKEEVIDWSSDHKYQEAEEYIFNYEVNALVSQNSEEANTRIIYLLNEIPIEGTKQPIGVTSHYYGSDYGNSCNRFNIKLNKILELAISTGNQDIAKKILPLYKEDENRDGINHITGYSYETKDAAQAKYDEAFGEKKEEVAEEIQSTPKESKKKRRR